ncbi:MAG: AI-2E family transporter [Nitrospiraceae bacterium]|nr:AI-2E family transporter [Nitrospiraceae bacterium]
MRSNRFYVLTSVSILVVLGYLTYIILKPFIGSLIWAAVFTIVFYPLYKLVLKFVKSKIVASSITVLIAILVIIGPLLSLFLLLIDELTTLAEKTDKGVIEFITDFFASERVSHFVSKVKSYFDLENVSPADIITGNIKAYGQSVVAHFSDWIKNITGLILDFVFMIFALFFFLKDGPDFLETIKYYLPFSDEQKQRLGREITDMVISTLYGGVMVSLIQGVMGGFAFFALNISSPVLWGAVMAVVSFLPVLGTFVVWGPVGIYLITTGSYAKGIALLVFGTLVIGIIDNMLRPIIVSGRTKIPTLFVLFSIIGGLSAFGIIGFIIGPLILALFFSVFAIFRSADED